jgi:hypothetical protein
MKREFLLCVENRGYEASLELWKLYERLPDREADRHNQVRVIDESGEDYLYSWISSRRSDFPQARGIESSKERRHSEGHRLKE